jgi:hypothetical protein
VRRRSASQPPPEPPAQVRAFNPADWPDDSADDSEHIDRLRRSWDGMEDHAAWWWAQDFEYRAEHRWWAARRAWCEATGYDYLDLIRDGVAVKRSRAGGGWDSRERYSRRRC